MNISPPLDWQCLISPSWSASDKIVSFEYRPLWGEQKNLGVFQNVYFLPPLAIIRKGSLLFLVSCVFLSWKCLKLSFKNIYFIPGNINHYWKWCFLLLGNFALTYKVLIQKYHESIVVEMAQKYNNKNKECLIALIYLNI